MKLSNYEMEILVNGHPVKEYEHDRKIFIEGRKSVEYSIKIKNNGYSRILAIPTVDGLSVLNGKEASYNSPGYIVEGSSSLVIDGWRTSEKDVAEFYFSSSKDSYSRKKGKGNLGVIGCAIFQENLMNQSWVIPNRRFWIQPWNPWNPWFQTTTYAGDTTGTDLSGDFTMGNSYVNQCSNSSISQDIGTGFGESKESRVTLVEFDKRDIPDVVFSILYNTKKGLEEIGIDFKKRPMYVAPRAFPNGFCQPPR